ncbi:hypothetical protein ATANTOWER_024068 [Ataeniobius toweri]|uniref:Secreted protein n=1 Tax=Ataeniobius toweri TaxID=208326 RepID=A0ABU7A964_9TELE|nr:hypothetical protein [Ataeniobius toweri]
MMIVLLNLVLCYAHTLSVLMKIHTPQHGEGLEKLELGDSQTQFVVRHQPHPFECVSRHSSAPVQPQLFNM